MSEVIVRMEMPKGCASCPMVDDDARFCKAAKEYIPMLGKPSWCPIVGELPERHDRLVSEKAVRWAIDDIVLEIASRTGRVAMTKNETMEYVKRLPTIIAAERKDDEQADY